MRVTQQEIIVNNLLKTGAPLEALADAVAAQMPDDQQPIRMSIVGKDRRGHQCEVEALADETALKWRLPNLFEFRRRERERTSAFNAVMLIPTGVDCQIGGHAGDATPSARLLASVCDNLVLHPNVVNASDVNEQTENCLYTEGSIICRLLMGQVGLQKVRQNRMLLVTEERPDAPNVVDQTINCAEGARATLGCDIREVVVLEEGLMMKTGFTESGRVTGTIERMERLMEVLEAKRGTYDTIALATKITPHIDTLELHKQYFGEGGANPWGGVEAVLTHLISTALDVPAAHAPTMSSEVLKTQSWGVVEPRKAMEIISTTYLFCVLKGLNKAPRVVAPAITTYDPSVVSVEDISALVIPDGCVGLPTLAAVEQGIPVIAVRGNRNLMKNDLKQLPFRRGQLMYADNYFEAAGLLSAIKAGVPYEAVVRPMGPTKVTRIGKPEVKTNGVHKNGKASGVVAGINA